MSEPVGIDLGTNYTRIACFSGDPASTNIDVIQDNNGDYDVPSVVACNRSHFMGGKQAELFHRSHPESVIYNVRSLISQNEISRAQKPLAKLTKNKSLQVFPQSSYAPQVLLQGQSKIPINKLLTPLFEIHQNSFKLRKSKAADRATIAVPAYFGTEERKVVEDAAKAAGFQTVNIVNESTAATVEYKKEFHTGDGNYIVVNFSGKGFEISTVQVSGDRYITTRMSVAQGCGGAEFDKNLFKYVLRAHHIDPHQINSDPYSKSQLQEAILEQKPVLANATSQVSLIVPPLTGIPSFTCNLSPAALEQLGDNFTDAIEKMTEEILDKAGIVPEDKSTPTYLVITGGMSNFSFFRNTIAAAAHMDIKDDHIQFLNTSKAIALGAAEIGLKILKGIPFTDSTIGISPISYIVGSLCLDIDGQISEIYSSVIRVNAKKKLKLSTGGLSSFHVDIKFKPGIQEDKEFVSIRKYDIQGLINPTVTIILKIESIKSMSISLEYDSTKKTEEVNFPHFK